YGRRTFATADASVMLVVDSRDAVGPDVATWGGGQAAAVDEPISLDLAREAAAAIAHVVLAAGDRVGLDDLGLRRRPVRPAAGRGQFERISRRLAALAPESFPSPRKRAPQVPSSALLVMFSTVLDDEAARMARTWRGQGHRVIAVDTLPPVRTTGLDALGDFAYQVVQLERQVRLDQLRRSGVEMLRWIDPEAPGASGIQVAWRLLTRARPRRGSGVPGRPGAGVHRGASPAVTPAASPGCASRSLRCGATGTCPHRVRAGSRGWACGSAGTCRPGWCGGWPRCSCSAQARWWPAGWCSWWRPRCWPWPSRSAAAG